MKDMRAAVKVDECFVLSSTAAKDEETMMLVIGYQSVGFLV